MKATKLARLATKLKSKDHLTYYASCDKGDSLMQIIADILAGYHGRCEMLLRIERREEASHD